MKTAPWISSISCTATFSEWGKKRNLKHKGETFLCGVGSTRLRIRAGHCSKDPILGLDKDLKKFSSLVGKLRLLPSPQWAGCTPWNHVFHGGQKSQKPMSRGEPWGNPRKRATHAIQAHIQIFTLSNCYLISGFLQR